MAAPTHSVPSLALGLLLGALGAVLPRPAAGADLHLGFRIGATETVGTTVSDNQALFLLDPTTTAATSGTTSSTRLQGVQFTTSLAGNVSVDVLTSALNHAFVLGAGFTQTIPTAVPDDAAGAPRDRISTLQTNAQWLAVVQRPRWGLAFGAGWTFLSNGRLVTPSDGATPASSSAGGAQTSAPGQTLSSFVVSGQVHTLNATTQLQLLRQRWDLTLGGTWVYTNNGVFNLAPGAPGVESGTPGGASRTQLGPQLPRVTTNVGTFLRATTHSLTPTATLRVRAGARGLVTASALTTLTLPIAGEDQSCVRRGTELECVPLSQAGTLTSTLTPFTLRAPLPVPTTLSSIGSLEYLHAFGPERQAGLRASGTFGLRVPADPATLQPAAGAALDADSAIAELSAIYLDLLPGDVRLTATAGLAQPWLFQPPLGSTTNARDFGTVRGDPTPIFSLTVSRFFNPVNASVTALRRVGVGALGASAVVTNGASLDFSWQPRVFGRVGQLGVGFNANETRGVGREALAAAATPCDPLLVPTCALLQIATDNQGVGANLGLQYPLFAEGMFTGLFGATYNLSWFDPDPDGTLGRPAYVSHAGLLTLSLTFGRGPLQELGPGSTEGAELSAFSADPANGSPLTSARLIRAGAPLLDGRGRRPGEPVREREDDQQEAQVNRRREAAERDGKARTDVVQGEGSTADDEAAALERQAEERRAREARRTRQFSEWPIDQLLPKPPEGDDPPTGDGTHPPSEDPSKKDAKAHDGKSPQNKPDAKEKPKDKPSPKDKADPKEKEKPKKDAKARPDGGPKDSPDDLPEGDEDGG